jgi:hypothetical protein
MTTQTLRLSPANTQTITLNPAVFAAANTAGAPSLSIANLTPAQLASFQNMGPPSPTGQPTGGPVVSSAPASVPAAVSGPPAPASVPAAVSGPPAPASVPAAVSGPPAPATGTRASGITAQDALDYYRKTGDKAGTEEILRLSAGFSTMPSGSDRAATPVPSNVTNADLARLFPGIDLTKLTPIQIEQLKRAAGTGSLSVDDLKRLFEGSSFDVNFVAPSGEARGDLDRLGAAGVSPYAPVDSFFGRKKGPDPVRDPLAPITTPVREPVSMVPSGYSPGFSAVVPDFTQLPAFATRGFRQGGSVSKRDLDSLPRYQAGGPVSLNRPLPSENRFMRDRLAEYETYNKAIEPYNRAVEEYQQQYGGYKSAYDKYMADVEAYNRAADAYNAGPRTEAFAMQQPSFSAQAPGFSAQAPARPSFSPEQFQEYQRQAMRRAGQRGTALEEAISRGIVSPEIARILGRGVA